MSPQERAEEMAARLVAGVDHRVLVSMIQKEIQDAEEDAAEEAIDKCEERLRPVIEGLCVQFCQRKMEPGNNLYTGGIGALVYAFEALEWSDPHEQESPGPSK